MVSIIIVNYNTVSLTCDCIRSIIEHTSGIEYEIIVVDNASPTEDPEEIIKQYPSVILVKSSENGGFSKGNNLGIAHAKGDIILLLNSDTYLIENSILKAATHFKTLEHVGALTVRLTYRNGKLQKTARKFKSIGNELLDLCRPFVKLLSYKRRSQLMLNQYFNGDYNTYCDWVSGAFMMFRKDILNNLPNKKLDERFFMYGEDHLWCYQFREMGLLSYYYCETTVVHIHFGSTAPSKQMALLKKLIVVEQAIMKYRKGASVYYYLFSIILNIKELSRYYIKVIAKSLLKQAS